MTNFHSIKYVILYYYHGARTSQRHNLTSCIATPRLASTQKVAEAAAVLRKTKSTIETELYVSRMVQCFAPDCNHQSERERCRFFRFPSQEDQRKRWEKLIRREDKMPNKNSHVCSCHFKDEIKSNDPTIFKRNEKKIMDFPSPEKRRRKRREEERVEATEPIELADIPEANRDTEDQEFVPPLTCTSASTSASASASESRTVVVMQAEIDMLRREVVKLQIEANYSQERFSTKNLKGKSELYVLYTGLPNIEIFNVLFQLCSRFEFKYYYGWNVVSIKPEDQLLMTLMKLRRNDPHEDLAVRFNCSRHTVGNVLMTWIHVLHEILYLGMMSGVPTRLKNQACLPTCFSSFQNCRMVIDCTEVQCAIPQEMFKSNLTYSHYKHKNTLKGLVGVAPNGTVTFLSELYPGSVSDKEIVRDSNIMSIFQQGDLILADKGFVINDLVPAGVSLNVPPFLINSQFTKGEVLMTQSIAKARIHVERAIQRIKAYTILDYVPEQMRSNATKVWQVCGALTNFQYPLLKEVDCFFKPADTETTEC